MTDASGDIALKDFAPRVSMKSYDTTPETPAAPIVDIHNHLGLRDGQWRCADVGALVEAMDTAGVATIVNLDGQWGEELESNLARYDQAYPGRFVTFARVDWSLCSRPGWERELAAQFADAVDRGARGLKVWKNLGLHLRDERGRLLSIDDERLAPLWHIAADAGIPVLAHVGDPVAFFTPLDRHNERIEELTARPDWHFPPDRFPALSTIIEALESTVTSHPDTTFIGAHVGCLAEDLDRVEALLERADNYYVDIAARIAELGRQPRRTAAMIARFPDRVMLGTDCSPPRPGDYRRYVRFLETQDESFPYSDEPVPPSGRWAIHGLGLAREVAARVEGDTARHLLGLPTPHA